MLNTTGASGLGAVANATPWGAAIGAIGGVAQAAIASDAVPVTSGGGQTQIGGMTIGSKTVGSGSTGGTSTAQSAAQTPQTAGEQIAQPIAAAASQWLPLAAAGLAALAVVLVLVRRK